MVMLAQSTITLEADTKKLEHIVRVCQILINLKMTWLAKQIFVCATKNVSKLIDVKVVRS